MSDSSFSGLYDVVVVGGGPSGLAAAVAAVETGADRVLVLEREEEPGGILRQCVHSGFGLHYFKEELTGPEYAERFVNMARDHGVTVAAGAYVYGLSHDSDGTKKVRVMRNGIHEVRCRSIILATGCRERTRGAIRIPGSRPSGVFTAGLAQRLINIEGYLPGKRVVVLGSGDIGLIMSRRLALEGCDVRGVFEMMPFSNGLARNIVQCLRDFSIPLHLSTTVVEIHGSERLEAVTVAPVDPATFKPDMTRSWKIECDTLLLSIGLIPENELSQSLGIQLNVVTGGPMVSSCLQTSLPGVFVCGNGLQVHDLVDYATRESLLAGRFAAEWSMGIRRPQDNISLTAGSNVRYCVPNTLSPERSHTICLRCKEPMKPCSIRVGDLLEKKIRFATPSEMIILELHPEMLERFHGDSLRIDLIT